MALREKLRERVQPFLEEGEETRFVFLGQTGPSPYFILLTYLVFFFSKMRVVAVTNRGIVVLNASRMFPSKPRELIARVPRRTRFGPQSGLWGKVELAGERVWVHKRFHKDLAAADAELDANQPG